MPEDRLAPIAEFSRLHLRVGWWSLLIFLTLGLALEALHGFKAGLYLDVSNATRREMWTLAHAHGTLVSLINVLFGLSVDKWGQERRRMPLASRFLLAGSFLLPVGFFLGGTTTYGADPGLGILLVPAGGMALLVAVFITAWTVAAVGKPASTVQVDDKAPSRDRGLKRKR